MGEEIVWMGKYIISISLLGYVSWVGKPAIKNAVLVDILEEAGAILYVKTNIPQTLMVTLLYCTFILRSSLLIGSL